MTTDPNPNPHPEPSPTAGPAIPGALASGALPTGSKPPEDSDELLRMASAPPPSLWTEFLDFLAHNKKWWLMPILIVLALFGLLIALAGTSAAPFIYTMF